MKNWWNNLSYGAKWTTIMGGFLTAVGIITYTLYRLQQAGIIG